MAQPPVFLLPGVQCGGQKAMWIQKHSCWATLQHAMERQGHVPQPGCDEQLAVSVRLRLTELTGLGPCAQQNCRLGCGAVCPGGVHNLELRELLNMRGRCTSPI